MVIFKFWAGLLLVTAGLMMVTTDIFESFSPGWSTLADALLIALGIEVSRRVVREDKESG